MLRIEFVPPNDILRANFITLLLNQYLRISTQYYYTLVDAMTYDPRFEPYRYRPVH